MFKIPQKIEYCLNVLNENGYEAYIVGGCVRDMLLGNTPHDFDITTSAKPENIEQIFKKTVPTGIKHGTVTVIIDNTPIEITTFRTEGSYTDYRRPDNITFVSSLSEDLSRRDFTVNAFAYNQKVGLVDLFNGKADLQNKILRAVGQPYQRFNEDALRIMRLFRFACVLGFRIEENTLKDAIKASPLLKNISSERISSELLKSFMGKNTEVFTPLIDSGALTFLTIKENPDYKKFNQLNYNSKLAFFSFFYLSKSDVLTALKVLKMPNTYKNYCKDCLKLLKTPLPQNKFEIKMILKCYDLDLIFDFLNFKSVVFSDDTTKIKETLNEIVKTQEPYKLSQLKINGKDLLDLKYKDKEIGDILDKLLLFVMKNPQKNTKENLIKETEKLT